MISVCIATYNGEKYIKNQVESILVQLSDDDEIIISDDGSKDSTLEILRSYNDKRIKIYVNRKIYLGKKPHWYVTKNFENALRHSSGDYIFLSDQDDVWLPNKVQICISELKDTGALLHNLTCVDANLNSLGYNWFNANHMFHYRNLFLLKGKHMGCALAFKRELLNIVLPFPKNLVLHDFWIGILAELTVGLKYIDIPLVQYRIHSNNTSGARNKRHRLFYQIRYRVYIFIQVFIRFFRLIIMGKFCRNDTRV